MKDAFDHLILPLLGGLFQIRMLYVNLTPEESLPLQFGKSENMGRTLRRLRPFR